MWIGDQLSHDLGRCRVSLDQKWPQCLVIGGCVEEMSEWGWGGGLVNKALGVHTRGPEFGASRTLVRVLGRVLGVETGGSSGLPGLLV